MNMGKPMGYFKTYMTYCGSFRALLPSDFLLFIFMPNAAGVTLTSWIQRGFDKVADVRCWYTIGLIISTFIVN